jgi:endonuclease/exonuclease/phosphatase family metal-dependent hydrolase
MRVLTWNIQWGLGMDGVTDLKRIVERVMDMADPDILCFQEVSSNMPELKGTSGANQFAELATLLPLYAAVAGATVEIFDHHGHPRRFGNAMFSRLPVERVLRHTLPWLPAGERNMPRGLIETTVVAPFGPLRIMTTHLEYFSAEARAAQVDAIRAVHAQACTRASVPPARGTGPYEPTSQPTAALLMGDFNMHSSDPTKHRISESFANGVPRLLDAWTVRHGDAPHPNSFCITDQTYGPPHCCDFIFVGEDIKDRVADIAYDTDVRYSDHQPVSIRLQ